MLKLKQNPYALIYAIFIMSGLICLSFQQDLLKTITTTKELTFCLRNHTMSNTLQTFWQDANGDCELQSRLLIQLYSQLISSSQAEEDKCSALLKHKIRKKLIQVMSTQLEEALITNTLHTNRELKQDLKEILEMDRRVAQVIWERVINEVYVFVEPQEIINNVMQLAESDLQIVALQCILNKYLQDVQQLETLLPFITFHVSSLYKKKKSSTALDNTLQRFYQFLPKELRLLYDSSKQTIGLLNYYHFEYLYAPRDNGPDNERRVALTWSKTKNSTDTDGHLLVSFSDQGLVSFGNRYGSAIKYLYADVEHQAAFFWIGSGLKSSRWWQVIRPHKSFGGVISSYLMFQNEDTQELLCATAAYDENRRYVTLLSKRENIENPACYWLINKF